MVPLSGMLLLVTDCHMEGFVPSVQVLDSCMAAEPFLGL